MESFYRNTHEDTFTNLIPAPIRNGNVAIQRNSNKFINDLINEQRSDAQPDLFTF